MVPKIDLVTVNLAYNTPGLKIPASGPAGILFATLAPGDHIPYQPDLIYCTTAWNGSGSPSLNWCSLAGRGNLPGTAPTSQSAQGITSISSPSPAGLVSSSSLFSGGPYVCVAAATVYLYVDDGSGADPGATSGALTYSLAIIRA